MKTMKLAKGKKTGALIYAVMPMVFLLSLANCTGTTEEPKRTAETTMTETLTIVKYGPETISAGVPFNVQPDGTSGMWVSTAEELNNTVVVVWNDIELMSLARDNLVTAVVPSVLFAKEGENLVYLLDTATGVMSKKVPVTVK